MYTYNCFTPFPQRLPYACTCSVYAERRFKDLGAPAHVTFPIILHDSSRKIGDPKTILEVWKS